MKSRRGGMSPRHPLLPGTIPNRLCSGCVITSGPVNISAEEKSPNSRKKYRFWVWPPTKPNDSLSG